VAEVAYNTPLGRLRTGVASHYLSDLKPSDEVYCHVRKGTFPSVPLHAPLLLIGPGFNTVSACVLDSVIFHVFVT
jgi:sulfite reductase alpha subunit-like flavoprotein